MDNLLDIMSLDAVEATQDKGKQIMDSLLLNQYQNSPLLKEYFMSFISELDFLFNQVEEVYTGRFLSKAVGNQLDILGELLQQTRSIVLPNIWFGFEGAPDVGGMASTTSPGSGGLFRSLNQSVGDSVPLEDDTYRRVLVAKAYLLNQPSLSLEIVYEVVSILLGRIPSVFELDDADTVYGNSIMNSTFSTGVEYWEQSKVGTGALIESNVGWSPNYKDDGFVRIPVWHGKVGDTVEFNLISQAKLGVAAFIFDVGSSFHASRGFVAISRTGYLSWDSSVYKVYVDGALTATGTFFVDLGRTYSISAELLSNASIGIIGALFNGSEKFSGKIFFIKFNGKVDKRYYKANYPEELGNSDLKLVDENGFEEDDYLANFVETGYVEIPKLVLSGDFEIEQTLTPNSVNPGHQMMSLGGESPDLWGFHYRGTRNIIVRFPFASGVFHHELPITPAGQVVSFKLSRVGTVVSLYIDGKLITSAGGFVGDLLPITRIGSRGNGGFAWAGLIYNTKFTDLTHPANSRHYSGVTKTPLLPEKLSLKDYSMSPAQAPWFHQEPVFSRGLSRLPSYKAFQNEVPNLNFVDSLYNKDTAPWFSPNYLGTSRKVSIPTWVGAKGDKISLRFIWNGNRNTAPKLLDGNLVGRSGIYLSPADGSLVFQQDKYGSTICIDGCPYSSYSFTPEVGKAYLLEANIVSTMSVEVLGTYFGGGGTWDGRIWDVKLQNKERPLFSRNYPSLEYRPDGGTSGDVLPQAFGEYSGEDWTPRYAKNGIVNIPRIILPTGSSVSLDFRLDSLHQRENSVLFDGSGSSNRFYTVVTAAGGLLAQGGLSYSIYPKTTPSVCVGIRYSLKVTNTGNNNALELSKLGGRFNNADLLDGNLWNVRIIDSSEAANSRYYPSIISQEVRPQDSVVTLLETNNTPISDTFSTGWVGEHGGIISGNSFSVTDSKSVNHVCTLHTKRKLLPEIPVELSFDLVSANKDFRVYVYKNTIGDQNFNVRASDVGKRLTFVAGDSTNILSSDDLIAFRSISVGSSFEVANVKVRQLVDGTLTGFTSPVWENTLGGDGKLVGFPVGQEWAKSGVPSLSDGTLTRFNYPTWVKAPSTDGLLERFTNPVWSRIASNGLMIVTPPNGNLGFAQQVLPPLEVRAGEDYNIQLDWNNKAGSKCQISLGTESEPTRYYSNGGVAGSGHLDVTIKPDLREPVYVRLGSVEKDTWSTFDNVDVTQIQKIGKRRVELVLSDKDSSEFEVRLISYMAKYFVPLGVTFTIKQV